MTYIFPLALAPSLWWKHSWYPPQKALWKNNQCVHPMKSCITYITNYFWREASVELVSDLDRWAQVKPSRFQMLRSPSLLFTNETYLNLSLTPSTFTLTSITSGGISFWGMRSSGLSRGGESTHPLKPAVCEMEHLQNSGLQVAWTVSCSVYSSRRSCQWSASWGHSQTAEIRNYKQKSHHDRHGYITTTSNIQVSEFTLSESAIQTWRLMKCWI